MMDFHVLRWKFQATSTAIRQFFIKAQRSQEPIPSRPDDRTLVVVNIPSYCNETNLDALFSRFGHVQSVHLQKNLDSSPVSPSTSDLFRIVEQEKITGYKVAFIVFRASKSIEKALSVAHAATEVLILSTDESPVLTGLPAWQLERKKPLPSLVELKREIDTYMDDYDTKVETERKKAKETEGVPDEEGWVTVTRVGKKRGIRQEDVTSDQSGPLTKKKNDEKELRDFYRFQVREGKTKQMSELRMKFEEDKQKQALMKSARKFKAF